MKHISIGGLDVSRIGLGAMSMAGYYGIGFVPYSPLTKKRTWPGSTAECR